MHFSSGGYTAALAHGYESQRMAKLCANLYVEAKALQVQVCCWQSWEIMVELWLYFRKEGIFLVLVVNPRLCSVDLTDRIHWVKSEYVEAHALHSQVLSTISAEKTPYFYAFLLLNGIPLELELGMSHDVIQMHMEISRSIFTGMNNEANMLFREISVGRLAMY